MSSKGKTRRYHSMAAAAVMARPGGDAAVPPAPEMIRNEGVPKNGGEVPEKGGYEEQKQDCERQAVQRLLEKQGEYCKTMKAAVLGDDLYANHTACKAVAERGLSFLFTCKDESPPWIAEQYRWSEPERLVRTEWNGKNRLEHRYRRVNGLENRAEGERLSVNYLYYEVYNRERDKMVCKNSRITDKAAAPENVQLLAECGRTGWKMRQQSWRENENNSVLKNYGYHLEHNFGHGERHACEIYCILNLFAFLVHGLMILCDEGFIKARSYFGRRDEFYSALRAFFWAFQFQSRDDFLLFVVTLAKAG